MAKRIEFDVIETTAFEDFREAVNQKLKEGWRLHGSMIAFPDFPDHESVKSIRYIQAFTRKEAKTEV